MGQQAQDLAAVALETVQDNKDPLKEVPADLFHLIPGFLQRRWQEVEELMGLLESGRFPSIGEIGHKLKGTGAGYGFQDISDLGHELELAAIAADRLRMGKAIQRLSEITRRINSAWDLRGKD